jgi:hypothetical protein
LLADGLPCLDLLAATPAILRSLMSELTDDDARWKPAPDRFSVAEVLAHLSHSEGHCYRMRVDRFMAETRPTFEADDAQMYLDLYRDADPEDAFDHFEEQRESNAKLPARVHREAGQITLNQMLHEWALHDLGHIRQIAELVRARKYPLGADYPTEAVIKAGEDKANVLCWRAVALPGVHGQLRGPSAGSALGRGAAESIYEAAALGVPALKEQWPGRRAPGTELEVQVRELATCHRRTVQQIRRWCDGSRSVPTRR